MTYAPPIRPKIMALIRDTEYTEESVVLWRIGRCRFSIKPQAFGHSLIAPKGLEIFLFVSISRQTKTTFSVLPLCLSGECKQFCALLSNYDDVFKLHNPSLYGQYSRTSNRYSDYYIFQNGCEGETTIFNFTYLFAHWCSIR